jgi:iron complex outermembrane receptor protein
VYASFSQGFKSGVYNASVVTSQANIQLVNPEKLTAYEVGAKVDIPDTSWYINVALYQYLYKDIQLSAFAFPVGRLLNAASANPRGVEVEFGGLIEDGLSFHGFGAYNDAHYSSFPDAATFQPKPGGGDVAVNGVDESGQPMLRTPSWTGGANLDYVHRLFSGEIDATGNLYYSSSYCFEITCRIKQSGYSTLNLNLGWSPDDNSYRVELWGTNVTDTHYLIHGTSSANADAVVWAAPTRYGIRFTRNF